jgi:hypothetical protein
MWYTTRLHPRRLTYNETVPIYKEGPFDAEALRQALHELVRRHESLRTHLSVVAGKPVQVVGPVPQFDLPVIDLSHLSSEEAESEARRLVAAVSREPYNLRSDPLLRPLLFKFPEDQHRLYLAMHHAAFDGVSLVRVLMPELIALYEAAREGRPAELPDVQVRYVDYARWEQEWMRSPKAERRLKYWLDRLSAQPVSTIPLDHERTEEPRLGGGALPIAIPADQVDRLREASKKADATLFQLLAAGWSLLLSHYADREEVVFSTAADLRQRPELQSLVGCCLTPLALKVKVSPELRFTELIRETRNELLDGLDQIVPFERVVRHLPPSEMKAGNPVYQTMIVLEPAFTTSDPTWSLLMIDPQLIDAMRTFKLDLELQFHEQTDGSLVGQLIYDRDLFDRDTVGRFVDHLLSIYAEVAADPAVRVSEISRPATTNA